MSKYLGGEKARCYNFNPKNNENSEVIPTNRSWNTIVFIVFQNVILDLVSEGEVSENGDDGVTERRGGESGTDDEDPVFDGPLLQRAVNRNSTHVTLIGEGDGRNGIEHFHATFG